jgi:hypothetical protein
MYTRTQIEAVSYFLCQYRKNNAFQYTVLILGTYNPDTLYLCEQGCEDLWIFYEAKRGPQAKRFRKNCLRT